MPVEVTVSVDTEEDDWGRFDAGATSVRNIGHLPEVQDLLDEFGARPTYLVNHPPLVDGAAVAVLGDLARREGVEIGGHCHPWNTPPGLEGEPRSMMCRLTEAENVGLVRTVRTRLEGELGVRPTTFRAGRWALGPTVARALVREGFEVDASVTPLIDWSPDGGPDFTRAPDHGYRFHPDHPLRPDPEGALVELPSTTGFLRGSVARRAPMRRLLEGSWLRRTGAVGLLDRTGILARRWLSPEITPADEMIRLARNLVSRGRERLDVTFHSSALLPGATPFVRDDAERRRFLVRIRRFLGYCRAEGFEFRTLGEFARRRLGTAPPGDDRLRPVDPRR